ncbi:MAG TPA: hypothetical protein GX696_10425, partial [Pseudomonadaceae bacterium]|nr:hypothetical protein [Pseudomonadaceae bacterium]
MMHPIKFYLALASLLSVCSVTAQQQDLPSDTSTVVSRDIQAATPTEIIVTGRQPGPPMWKVSNGDNSLWIFAYLSPIPEDMIWESDKVEAVIAQSEVYLTMPQTRAKISRLVLANPINWIRGYRMAKRLSRRPNCMPRATTCSRAARR